MKLTLNLASRPYLNRRALYTGYAVLTAVLALLLALNLGFYMRSRAHGRQLTERLAELEREHSVEDKEATATFTPEAYEKLLKRIEFANGILEQDSFRWTDLLSHLEEVVPDNVGVTSIQPDLKGKTLRMTGSALRVEDLRQLLDNLIASPHFGDAYLLQQSRLSGKEGKSEGIGFTITVKGAF